MKNVKQFAKLGIVAASFSVMTLLGTSHLVSADSLIPIEITPICSDSASSDAYWTVNNKNSVSVDVQWTNIDNGHTDNYNAPAGMSQLATYYDGTDPNNTTQFVAAGNQTQTNATAASCQPGQITITVPSSGSGNTTTSSSSGNTTTASGSGNTNTVSSSSGNTNTAPGMGAGIETPVAPVAAVVTPVPQPELANTGASQLIPYVAAAGLSLMTAATTVAVRKNLI